MKLKHKTLQAKNLSNGWTLLSRTLLRGLRQSTNVLGSKNVTFWPTTDKIVSDSQGLLLAHYYILLKNGREVHMYKISN